MPPTTPRNAIRVMTCSKNVSCIICIVLPSLQPICNQEKSAHSNQAHYDIPPTGLSTHQSSDYSNESNPFRHVIEKFGRALSLLVVHILSDTGMPERLKRKSARAR